MGAGHLLASGDGGADSVIPVLIVWVLAIAAYWVPTVVAFRRQVRSRGSVVVVNLFLGWTLIGWVVTLAMAFREVDKPSDGWETAQPVAGRVRGR